jgi:phosphomannomutase
VSSLDLTDGVRIVFDNRDVAHIRPSGNADELRIYATADTQARADAIVAEGIREPDGILRSLERLVA